MLLLSSTSCVSKTVVIVPDLFFPSFPDPDGWIFLDENKNEVTDNDTDITGVWIPYEWVSGPLLDFKLEYDETTLLYFTIKNGYSGNR